MSLLFGIKMTIPLRPAVYADICWSRINLHTSLIRLSMHILIHHISFERCLLEAQVSQGMGPFVQVWFLRAGRAHLH